MPKRSLAAFFSALAQKVISCKTLASTPSLKSDLSRGKEKQNHAFSLFMSEAAREE